MKKLNFRLFSQIVVLSEVEGSSAPVVDRIRDVKHDYRDQPEKEGPSASLRTTGFM
jgi:hypothetical protein